MLAHTCYMKHVENMFTVMMINSLRQIGTNICVNMHCGVWQSGSVSWGDEEMVCVCVCVYWYVYVCVCWGWVHWSVSDTKVCCIYLGIRAKVASQTQTGQD